MPVAPVTNMFEKQLIMGFISGACIITLINFIITYSLQPKEYHNRILSNYLAYLIAVSLIGVLLFIYMEEAMTHPSSAPAIVYNFLFYVESYLYFRFISSAFSIKKQTEPHFSFFLTLANCILAFMAVYLVLCRYYGWLNNSLYNFIVTIVNIYFTVFILYLFWFCYKKSRNSQSLHFSWYGQLTKILSLALSLAWLKSGHSGNNNLSAHEATTVVIYGIGILVEILFFSVSVNLNLKDAFEEKITALKEIEQLQNLSKMQIAELHERNDFIRLEEQKKLGRDLHDIVANSVATAKMQIYLATLETKDAELSGQLQLITEQLSESYNTIRSKSHEWYLGNIEEISKKFIQKINFLVNSSFPDHLYEKEFFLNEETIKKIPSAMQINILLILQEAVTNILKHAKANKITISLYEDYEVVLQIKDNGTGFNHTQKTNGVGLQSMSERVHEMEGTLLIDSDKDGTEINVLIPLTE